MRAPAIYRFELDGRRFAIDTETCFCFECDQISWDVLEHYPQETAGRIKHLLQDRHDPKELTEVLGELEWLRATKSILVRTDPREFAKPYQVERGLKKLTVRVAARQDETHETKKGWFGQSTKIYTSADNAGVIRDAAALLLNRSENQKDLRLTLLVGGEPFDPAFLAARCQDALKAARLAGKNLTVAVRFEAMALSALPASLTAHSLAPEVAYTSAANVETIQASLKEFSGTPGGSLAKLSKVLQPAEGRVGRIVLTPASPEFAEAVQALHEAGFAVIEIDFDDAYAKQPSLNPADMLNGLRATARYYAESLLKNRYFRLDPIADLFWRIYDGQPIRRSDPIGTNELAVDADGMVYASARLLGNAAFCVGSVADGTLDDERLSSFDNVGVMTTAACLRCWAKNLCGGGTAAVHHVLSGSFRTPHEPWCEAQRAWMRESVSAFNILSANNVNFARLYQNLSPGAKPSLVQMVRAALKMTISIRPINEPDAPMLVQWENWTEAAYFLQNEKGLLMATHYDREMESLHPTGIDQEFIVTRRNGTPIGLLRLRPETIPGAARAWVYLRDQADYASPDVRKGFRALLEQAGKQQNIRRLTVPAMAQEKPLQEFLLAAGFAHEGTQRDGVFLHGAYHDVLIFGMVL